LEESRWVLVRGLERLDGKKLQSFIGDGVILDRRLYFTLSYFDGCLADDVNDAVECIRVKSRPRRFGSFFKHRFLYAVQR
jgi:hypothetical protein